MLSVGEANAAPGDAQVLDVPVAPPVGGPVHLPLLAGQPTRVGIDKPDIGPIPSLPKALAEPGLATVGSLPDCVLIAHRPAG